jgi:hypothetical protein
MMLPVLEKRFQVIIGRGHIGNLITREESPPAMADRLHTTSNDFGIGRLFGGFVFQVIQELFHLLFDLPRSPWRRVLISGFK